MEKRVYILDPTEKAKVTALGRYLVKDGCWVRADPACRREITQLGNRRPEGWDRL